MSRMEEEDFTEGANMSFDDYLEHRSVLKDARRSMGGQGSQLGLEEMSDDEGQNTLEDDEDEDNDFMGSTGSKIGGGRSRSSVGWEGEEEEEEDDEEEEEGEEEGKFDEEAYDDSGKIFTGAGGMIQRLEAEKKGVDEYSLLSEQGKPSSLLSSSSKDQEEEVKINPFNLDQEREEGFYDKDGNYVWKVQEKERDAWSVYQEEALNKSDVIQEAMKAKRRVMLERRKLEQAQKDILTDSTSLLYKLLLLLEDEEETPLLAMQRLKRKKNKEEEKEQEEQEEQEKKKTLEELIQTTDLLLCNGYSNIYESTKEEILQLYQPTTTNTNNTPSWLVRFPSCSSWRYEVNGVSYGPFSTDQMLAWEQQGYFQGEVKETIQPFEDKKEKRRREEEKGEGRGEEKGEGKGEEEAEHLVSALAGQTTSTTSGPDEDGRVRKRVRVEEVKEEEGEVDMFA